MKTFEQIDAHSLGETIRDLKKFLSMVLKMLLSFFVDAIFGVGKMLCDGSYVSLEYIL